MTIASRLSMLTLALAAALPLAAIAQTQTVTPTINAESFVVQAVPALVPGTELDFELRATPGAR
jgi:hypothetical protein